MRRSVFSFKESRCHLEHIFFNLLSSLCRLEGTVNRYRKLDMTVGEKEMVIAELQAKYVGECWRKFFFQCLTRA